MSNLYDSAAPIGSPDPIHSGDEETIADELTAPSESLSPRREPGIPAPIGKLSVFGLVIALVFFFGPALGWVAGDKAAPIENRALTPFPSLSQGWSFIPQMQQWANDHLPLRSKAITIGTAISQTVFGEPPSYGAGSGTAGAPGAGPPPQEDQDGSAQYPQVIEGPDGTLFFGGDVQNSCNPELDLDEIFDNLAQLKSAVESSGRTLVIAIAPDKSTVEAEKLPDKFVGEDCFTERKAAFWKMVESNPDLGIVDPRESFAALRSSISEPIYKKHDTHWGLYAAYQFGVDVATALDPALGASTTFSVDGTTTQTGDLSALLGTPQDDSYANVQIVRSGVSLEMGGGSLEPEDVPSVSAAPQQITASSTDAPLYPGKTLFLGDSFLEASRFMLPSYFSDFVYLHNQYIGEKEGKTVVPNEMVDADTIVVEIVERSFAGGQAELLQSDNIDLISETLAKNPK